MSCLTSRRLLKSINYAFISLILKVKIPKWVTKFKLISAYTVLYKILAKLIANRLYLVLLIPYFFLLFGFDRNFSLKVRLDRTYFVEIEN